MKLSTVAQAIDAMLHGEDRDFVQVGLDSRTLKGGELFIAIKGAHHDGHDFIPCAIQKNAKAILAERAPQGDEKNTPFLQVKDTLLALGALARFWRTFYTLPTVGITGSCGKTTVKEMVALICQQQGKTLATHGNLNNHLGLPLTLLGLDPSFQFAVLEMGASMKGDIAYLGDIAKPDVALITNVRPAHLQGLGSLEQIAQTKGEIYQALSPRGCAIVNLDEPYYPQWQSLIANRKTITFGLNKQAMVSASDITLYPATRFTLHAHKQSYSLHLKVPGLHNVMNALASVSVALALDIPLEQTKIALESFEGVKGRLKKFKGLNGSIVIDDSYNANPGSMQAALEVLAEYPGEQILVMGDMAELGAQALDYHQQIGKQARRQGIARLLAIGQWSEYAVKAFGQGAKLYAQKETLISELKTLMSKQTVILIKASRAAGLESVAQALVEE